MARYSLQQERRLSSYTSVSASEILLNYTHTHTHTEAHSKWGNNSPGLLLKHTVNGELIAQGYC